MAIAEEIYDRCTRCLCDAKTLAESVQNGKTITPTEVMARRAAADIAADTAFHLLRQAFLTPIDREDLWVLRNGCEAVLRAVEDAALMLYCTGRGVPTCCLPVWEQVTAVCEVPLAVLAQFPRLQAVATPLKAIRDTARLCVETKYSVFADATARRVCEAALAITTACERVVEQLRYAALKNT